MSLYRCSIRLSKHSNEGNVFNTSKNSDLDSLEKQAKKMAKEVLKLNTNYFTPDNQKEMESIADGKFKGSGFGPVAMDMIAKIDSLIGSSVFESKTKINEANNFFSTDSLEMKRLGIKSTINWTVSAITGKSKHGDYTGLVEVDDNGKFNFELFIGSKHYDDGSFSSKPKAEKALLDFISDLEATGLV